MRRRGKPGGYGLVLAGGGCKGVYQIGVWRAMRELELPIECVVGTSVGAMNGALVALDRYEGAVELWKNMSIEKGFQLPEPLKVPDNLFSLKNAHVILRELWKNHGLDITPLRRALELLVDEKALRASPVEYGLVTFELTGRKGRELYRERIPEGRLMDYIMASAAYPGLKRPEIDGKTYLDGGLYDNVPVKMLLRRHPDNIVVVNIGDTDLPADLDPQLNLHYIKPKDSLGKAFAFNPETADSKMAMGWYDAMRSFGRLAGEWMYFNPIEYRSLQAELGEETVSGLEYAARLYGIDNLRRCSTAAFIRELRDCDRLAREKYRAFRARMDIPSMAKRLYEGRFREYSLTSDLLLQMAQELLAGKERPRLTEVARRMAPDLLRAAGAMETLRRRLGLPE
ncbi:MAG TPA: patatin-like phospholipase family protein [Firmicutes bacterium]|nr:patatin-like phospholipase family protein [Bacillota bacterium]